MTKNSNTRNILSILSRVEEWSVNAIFVLIFILVPAQVIIRYLRVSGITDKLVELTSICLVWAVAVGMVRLLHQEGHLKVPFIEERLGDKAGGALRIFLLLASAGALVLLLWSTYRTATEFADMKTPMLGWSYLAYYGVLLVFTAIGVITVTVMLAQRLMQMFGKTADSKSAAPAEK